MILAAHIHISAARNHKGDAAAPDRKVFRQESISRQWRIRQSSKLRAKAYRWNEKD